MQQKKPEWLKLKMQSGENTTIVESVLKDMNLNTVCSAANCPNRMECYARRVATFMIMGRYCTRNCKFCNVETKKPLPLDPDEPLRVAQAVQKLGLKHAVITSVDRDDLKDEGAHHFAMTCRMVKLLNPNTTVELLIPDFHAKKELLDIVLDENPDVLNHNIEVVSEIFDRICPQSNFEQSLDVLRYSKERGFVTKSGFIVGFGETKEMVINLLHILKDAHVDMITIGQYMQPTKKHAEVIEYVHPDTFAEYKMHGLALGFKRVESSPLVRSSYHAEALKETETGMWKAKTTLKPLFKPVTQNSFSLRK